LGSPLEPADDLAGGDVSGHPRQQLLFSHPPIGQPGSLESARDLGVGISAAVEGVIELEAARMTERLMIMPERAPERSARVRGARWHPDRLVVRVAQDTRVGTALKRNPAGQAEIAGRVTLGEGASNMHHGRFDRGLQREGKIAMTVSDGLVRLAPRTERLREPLLERLLDAVGVVAD